MNIAFLSFLSPMDIHCWSGTLYYMYQELSKRHHVKWIGGNLYAKMKAYHSDLHKDESQFNAEEYAKEFGTLISIELQSAYYDAVICRDYFYLAYLVAEIPIIYIGDTTFHLFKDYLGITDECIIRQYDELERLAIARATKICYPTPWAKKSAMEHYGKNAGDVEVIEFGANIPEKIPYKQKKDTKCCNLLFVGTNWNMKGGDKVLDVYHKLKQKNLNCKLTIIGSTPDYTIDDPEIKIYPRLDKGQKDDRDCYNSILEDADILLAPTVFDCYGIVYCEAAANGIVVLTNNVCGINHVVKDGITGYLFDSKTQADVWAEKIQEIISSKKMKELSCNARKEYEERLNWKVWGENMEMLINKVCPCVDMYMPMYAINLPERKDRKEHILSEFNKHSEFELHFVNASRNSNSRLGLWQSIVRIVRMASEMGEQFVVLCEDDHYFTKNYSPKLLMAEMQLAFQLGADILSGGIGGFGRAVKRGFHLYEVDWFWCTQFIVIYSSLYERILSYNFKEEDTADGILSTIAKKKMVIYPFISEQKDFGYSDVTRSNQENEGRIREHFKMANHMFEYLEHFSYNQLF